VFTACGMMHGRSCLLVTLSPAGSFLILTAVATSSIWSVSSYTRVQTPPDLRNFNLRIFRLRQF